MSHLENNGETAGSDLSVANCKQDDAAPRGEGDYGRTDQIAPAQEKNKEVQSLPANGTAALGFPYRSRDVKASPKDRDPNSSPIRSDNERLRVSPNRVLNYGSMERSRRGEHRNPHFERRLSYGYGQPSVVHQEQMDGRNAYDMAHRAAGTGSLERGKNFGYMDRDQLYGYGPKRDKFSNHTYASVKPNEPNQNADYSGIRNDRRNPFEPNYGGSPNKTSLPNYGSYKSESLTKPYGSDGSSFNYTESPNKSERTNYAYSDSPNRNEGVKDFRYSPSKTDSMNRTSYYSHASRVESSANQNDRPPKVPNVRRSSYDFDRSPSKNETAGRQVNYGYKPDPQGKPYLPDFGGDRRRLSQPPGGTSGVPPPFYHPPPPPGKCFFYGEYVFMVRGNNKCLVLFRRTSRCKT